MQATLTQTIRVDTQQRQHGRQIINIHCERDGAQRCTQKQAASRRRLQRRLSVKFDRVSKGRDSERERERFVCHVMLLLLPLPLLLRALASAKRPRQASAMERALNVGSSLCLQAAISYAFAQHEVQ